MTAQPLDLSVSVVIPTYNRADRVVHAVASVLAQREVEPEVIVVDDGSEEDIEVGLAPFRGRLRIVRQKHLGVSAARNRGVAESSGAWIAFLDSDDEWLPHKTLEQLHFHRDHREVLVSQTGELWIRDGVRVNPCKHHAKPSGDIFVPSLARCLVSPSAVMLRRDLFTSVGGFDESMPVCEDYDLWLRLSLDQSFGLVEEPLMVKYGGHADQLSRQYWGMDRFRVLTINRLLAEGRLSRVRQMAAQRVLTAKCAVLAKGARRRGRREDANSYEALAGQYVDG